MKDFLIFALWIFFAGNAVCTTLWTIAEMSGKLPMKDEHNAIYLFAWMVNTGFLAIYYAVEDKKCNTTSK